MKKLREITKTVVAPKKNVVDDAFQQFGISAGAATLRNRDQGFGHQTNVPGTVGLQHPQTKFGTERPKKKKKDKGFTVIDAEPKYYLAPKRKKPPCISKTAIDLLPVLHEQLKTKQKTITLPEDLVESGTFPNLKCEC